MRRLRAHGLDSDAARHAVAADRRHELLEMDWRAARRHLARSRREARRRARRIHRRRFRRAAGDTQSRAQHSARQSDGATYARRLRHERRAAAQDPRLSGARRRSRLGRFGADQMGRAHRGARRTAQRSVHGRELPHPALSDRARRENAARRADDAGVAGEVDHHAPRAQCPVRHGTSAARRR